MEGVNESLTVLTNVFLILSFHCLSYKMQLQVNVSGTMTDSIFEKVFTKNVAAAQPLPGFRRMKGGIVLKLLQPQISVHHLAISNCLQLCHVIRTLILQILNSPQMYLKDTSSICHIS